jgi:ATPase family protein associated with various cellular activities (AAA)
MLSFLLRGFVRTALQKTLSEHFRPVDLAGIVTAARDFPITSRVDVQAGLERVLAEHKPLKLLGVHTQMSHETPSFAHLCAPGPFQVEMGPLQHEEIDIGDPAPVRCLKNGLWLGRSGTLSFAVLLAPTMRYGQVGGEHVEIAVPGGEAGAEFSQNLFRQLEIQVGNGRTYRGRVISLESYQDFSGRGGAVKVHRLHTVTSDEVILPKSTLALLDRNVMRFVEARKDIKALRFSGKKGLLFYGPPGTGKTHTIHYLASHLPEHTTLLVNAEQVVYLSEYFRLARFLQPAMMVVEDVDLIAREREHMHTPGQEMLLNKLLNEMDGLREDAEILFILTTNRPDQLEPALASRPGRIDQAIEFPLPDAEGRRKLATLYARGIEVPAAVMDVVVRRTEGASPAFIKELMRRSAQFQIERQDGGVLQEGAVDSAIEEMVFTGGTLNVKLLGGRLPH